MQSEVENKVLDNDSVPKMAFRLYMEGLTREEAR